MLQKGTRVTVSTDGVDYPGVVTKCCDDDTYEVKFDDGDDGDGYKESDLTVIVAEPPQPKAAAAEKPALSKVDIEKQADKARKAGVDAENAKMQKLKDEEEAKLASQPLNTEEQEFIAMTRPKMNMGRQCDQPSIADIRRYAGLVKRQSIT